MSKVLLVDDDFYLLDLYKRVFTIEKFEVITATDGIDALEKLKIFTPEIILLDIMMPKMNGIELLKQIKSMSNINNIPVIILSNINDAAEEKMCMEAGAVQYIVKSDKLPNEIVQITRKVISQQSAQTI